MIYFLFLDRSNLMKKVDYLCFEYQNIDNYKFDKKLLLENLQLFKNTLQAIN